MNQSIIGQIDKILFEDNGFFIAILVNGDKISGTYYESSVENIIGSAVTLSGEWQEHKKYGKSFKFETISVNQNKLFFFLNKILKGFTKKLSAELIEKFGEDGLIEILDNDIEKLLEFKGVKEKRLKKIQESWKSFRSMREIGEFLSPFGVSPTLLTTIANGMKNIDNPCKKLKNNPYILTSIHSIGFKKADELALKMGVGKEDEGRISSAMDYVLLNYCESNGNSCITKTKLFDLLEDLMGFDGKNHLYELALQNRVAEQNIKIMKDDRVSPMRLYDAEKFLYDDFKTRALRDNNGFVKNIDKFIKDCDLSLGEEQKNAVEKINNGASVLFLVGYAGTGKSTVSRAMLDLLNKKYDKKEIMTCALSGIASQRISDTTGYESATIQSLLVRFEHIDNFPFSVLLIDEASMINSMLFAKIVKKVKKDSILIIVGDDAQLPPIGAGNILSDVLSLKIVPTVKLTKIYRQSDEQAIKIIANDIRVGVIPAYKQKYDDFEFINISSSSEAIISEIAHKVLEFIENARDKLNNKKIKEYLNYFQVISPMKSGELGTINLNIMLQKYFNPNPTKKITQGSREFRLMDKVVHIKNENMNSWSNQAFKDGDEPSQRRIFNGMSGLLFKIDENTEQAFVFYPNEDIVVTYGYDEIKQFLMLSYALTIHKVQGMEYDIVIMPMSFSHYIMHNTKLIYTAITRAKHKCIVIGESRAFENACRKLDATSRDTVMLEI